MSVIKPLFFVVVIAYLVGLSFAWTIDTTKYPTPPNRDTNWNMQRDEFDSCAFGYGYSYSSTYQDYTGATFPFDYVAIWYNEKEPNWNEWWIGKALDVAIRYNKPFAIYAYVIATSAKLNLGIHDCDVHPTENLCYKGANWMRQNWESNIIPQYKLAAEEITKAINIWNTANPTKKYTKSILWLIEPDFQQYRDATQIGGPIAPDELTGKYYVEIVSTIARYQTATKNKFFTDTSPWLNDAFKTWQEGYPKQYVDGFFGGWNAGSDFIKTDSYNLIKYSDLNKLYLTTTDGDNQLPIIGQAGWGVNGAGVDNWRPWVDVTNIRARLVNHLVAATFQHDNPTTLVSQMNELLGKTRNDGICWWRDRTGDGPVVDGGGGGDGGTNPTPVDPVDDENDDEEEWTIDTTKYPTPPPRDTLWDFVRDELNGCSFGYGVGYVDEYKNPQFASFPFDYITVWYQNKESYWNEWWIGKALALAIKYNKPLGIFAYVIAGSAKENLDIQDCDVHPTENLCHKGANWIREQWESNIIPQYQRAGEEITKAIQTWNTANPTKKYTKSILWFIEPDFQQYRGAEQLGGGIPVNKLTGKYYVEIVSTIARYQQVTTNKFFVDVSPWLNDEFNTWMESYPQQYVDGFYGGLNIQAGNDYVKANAPYERVTYTQINQLYTTNHQGNNGLPIFGQAGWGVNGADQSSDVYKPWVDLTNIQDKLQKNVVAATFSNSNVNVIMDVMKNTVASLGENKQWDYGVCYWNNIQPETLNLDNASMNVQQQLAFVIIVIIISVVAFM